ncbi:MAG: DUF4199 domain-containing protein, partial [Chitinophagia bacterium]|nr:DUF4199 domain-containing protein [Chitinophagia bacterium]
MEPLSLKERNSTAALYGLLTGVANMLLITVAYTQVNNSMVMNGITMAGGALSLTLVGVLTAQIKKKNGGYLPFKETYGSIIIIMMVSTLLYVAYNYVYMMFIDPDFGLKIKAAVLR